VASFRGESALSGGEERSVRVIVSGSIAFDYLMHFPGRFSEYILRENLDCLSVSFLVDSLSKRYGGCGANVCYNLALLGEEPLLVGAAGSDFSDYREWLESNGVDTTGVLIAEGLFTSSFFVSTDEVGSQIASFYVGAMACADQVSLGDLGVGPGDLVLVSPSKPEAMLLHAREAKELGARLLFDPSQQLPRLDGEHLREAMDGAFALTVNEYEYALLKEKTGYSDDQVRSSVELLVVTCGAEGSNIWAHERHVLVPCVRARELVDPTGVGDAYRAGLMKGLLAGLDLAECGRIGSTAACFVAENVGTQDHRFTPDQFMERYEQAFGDASAVREVIGIPVSGREDG